MQVQVQLFARAKELAGTGIVTVELVTDTTVAGLKSDFYRSYPALANFLEHCTVAVNGEIASNDTPLSQEDEIAVLPPVSGGME